ncbi:MAG TPA: formylglycine-generating enzyme family protein [Chitinophagaceae bacterium]|nr:formylglycine-generating enzyme family protein [Chitinophagaceae bacterium]
MNNFYKKILIAATAIFFTACGNVDEGTQQNLLQSKATNAISCTSIGLTPNDSVLYMQQGGQDFKPSFVNVGKAAGAPPDGMVWIPGGEFSMGSINPVGLDSGGNLAMNDARPVHRVYVDGFYMDATEVTNAQFAKFVEATGYITTEERKPDPADFPGVPPQQLVAGSAVFTPPGQPVPLNNYLLWWKYVGGADWRHPDGPKSSIAGKDNYPVVQVSWEDAAAYAKWADKRLPTEAEWEFAARSGQAGELYPWGNQLRPNGKWMANIFEGSFPNDDVGADGYAGIAPVKSYPASKYGLYDIAGNVWEWCSDWYRPDYYAQLAKNKLTKNPQGPTSSYDPDEPISQKKVQRGGSFLCTDQYCTRYMVGTRGKGEVSSGSNHIGFRCVK